jgi:hypothetical protein
MNVSLRTSGAYDGAAKPHAFGVDDNAAHLPLGKILFQRKEDRSKFW